MTQGLNANMQAMSQAEKTLLRYQYVLSHTSDIQGDFARTSGTWANQIKLLKMQFQALGAIIGEGFINLLRPALQKITSWMNTLIALVRKVMNAIGKLLGWQVEITDVGVADEMGSAASGAEDMADDLGKGAKEAKKMKDYLLGIDELNIFRPDEDEEDSGSGSGKGSGGGASGGGGGKVSGGNARLVPYESDIKDWFDLGKWLAWELADWLMDIDWDAIQDAARRIAENIADFINGFIETPRLWYAIGHTIAQGLNTALIFADTLLTRIHWFQLGKDIGTMINQAVREFDWALLGKTIADGINAAFKFLHGFGQMFNPELLGEGIYTAINSFFLNFDGKRVAVALNIWADKLFRLVKTALGGIDWSLVWEDVKDIIGNLSLKTVSIIVGGILLKGLTKLSLTKALSTALGMPLGLAAVGSGITLAGTIWFTLKLKDDVSDRLKKFNEAGGLSGTLSEIAERWKEVAREAANANKANPYTPERIADVQKFNEWLGKVADALGLNSTQTNVANDAMFNLGMSVGTAARSHFPSFLDALSKANGSLSEGTDLTNNWGYRLGEFIKNDLPKFGEEVKNAFSAETWKQAFDGIKQGLDQKWQEIVTWWNGTALANWWTESVAPWFSTEKWYGLWEGVQLGISTKWTEIVTWWNETALVTWWEESVLPWFTVEKWLEVFQGIYDAIVQKWDEISAWWRDTAIFDWWENDVKPWFSFETWYELANGIWEGLKSRWKDINDWWRDTAIFNWWENDVKPWFSFETWYKLANGIWNGMKQRWNDITNWWRNTAMYNWIENDVKPKFTKEFWIEILTGMKNAWFETWTKVTEDAKNKVLDMYNKVKGWITEIAEAIQGLAAAIGDVISQIGQGAAQMAMAQYGLPPGKAEGGYVSSGQLFMARENGLPEMVGRIGRTTAVANNDQIVEAISLGVAMANSGVIDGLSQVVSAINNKDTSVNIGDRQIALAAASGQSLLGRSIIS